MNTELELQMNEAAREFLFAVLGELVDRIEVCGASPALTHAVCLASDLRSAIGNGRNAPDQNAIARVLTALQNPSRL